MSLTTSSVETLRAKFDHLKFCMLTTLNDDESLSSRPMTLQGMDADGVLWFFTSADGALARDLHEHPLVNLSFSKPSDNLFVSVSGIANVIKNREKAQDLWNPLVGAWFPQGVDDPTLVLIHVHIQSAEYWDSGTDKITLLFHMAKAAITGDRPKEVGEHAKIWF